MNIPKKFQSPRFIFIGILVLIIVIYIIKKIFYTAKSQEIVVTTTPIVTTLPSFTTTQVYKLKKVTTTPSFTNHIDNLEEVTTTPPKITISHDIYKYVVETWGYVQLYAILSFPNNKNNIIYDFVNNNKNIVADAFLNKFNSLGYTINNNKGLIYNGNFNSINSVKRGNTVIMELDNKELVFYNTLGNKLILSYEIEHTGSSQLKDISNGIIIGQNNIYPITVDNNFTDYFSINGNNFSIIKPLEFIWGLNNIINLKNKQVIKLNK